jgi:hypothetical protein
VSGTDRDNEMPEPESIKPLNPSLIGTDLDRLCEIIQRKAYAAIDWYVGARRSKKRAAWWIRLGAIFFVSLAGLVPVLDAAGLIDEQPTIVAVVAEGDDGSVDLRQVEQTTEELRGRFAGLELGQLGYVFAAIAAALVGLDRFLGLSTGWVRYITAELSLRKALADFQINWVIRNAELADDAGEQKCPRERLALIKDFSSRIDENVEAETRQWAAESQGAMAMLQTAVREAQETARPGTVQVTVQRGAGIRPEATVSRWRGQGPYQRRHADTDAGKCRWARGGSARTA